MKFSQKALIITGMHRSGTSLITSLLQKAGLNVGSNFLPPNAANIKGYFEDIDFFQFHEDVLSSQGFSKEGWTLTPSIKVQEQFLERAISIIENKQACDKIWGWKDPRTTLFLDFWQQQLSESSFIFIYRSPWDVIDSLYRRGDFIFDKNPNFALQIWLNYNQTILEFYERFPEKCFLINVYVLIDHFNLMIEAINQKFKVQLSIIDNIDNVYDKNLLKKDFLEPHRLGLIRDYFPESIDLYRKLIGTDDIFLKVDKSYLEEVNKISSYKSWILQDWHDLRKTEVQLNQLQREYQEQQALSEKQLAETESQLKNIHIQLKDKSLQLEDKDTQLENKEIELKDKDTQLQQTSSQLENKEIELKDKDTQLQQTSSQLENKEIELKDKDTQLQQVTAQLEDKDFELEDKEFELKDKNFELKNKDLQLQQTSSQLQDKNTQIEEKDIKLRQISSQLQKISSQLQDKNTQIEEKDIKLHQISSQLQNKEIELNERNTQLHQISSQLQNKEIELNERNTQLHQISSQLQNKEIELNERNTQLHQISSQLQNKEIEQQQIHHQLLSAHQGWEQSRMMIEAMESSKFWKLRKKWFGIKHQLGISDDSDQTRLIEKLKIEQLKKLNIEHLKKLDTEQIKKVLYWTATLQLPQRLKRRKIAQLISNSGLFDTGYYWEQNPDVKLSDVDPLGHYLDIGASEGRDPHPLFHTSYYTKQYPEVAQSKINPLAHYLTIGSAKGYKPCPTFDTGFYLKRYPDVAESGMNPLVHYIQIGVDKGLYPLEVPEINLPEPKLNSTYPAISPNIPKTQDPNYQIWLHKHYPSEDDLQSMTVKGHLLSYQPLISIIMPTYNTPVEYLQEAINSVLNQAYSNWELCIADDASTNSQVKAILEEYSHQDPRIKVIFRKENGQVCEASNSAIDIATGEFIALLDHDDLLTPHALSEVVSLLNRHPDADMIYSDEDTIDKEGYLGTPFFKPDWSPDSFLSRLYKCHLGVYRRLIVQKIGGFRAGYEGAQDYDLVLRFTEETEQIYHIPNILYHWRIPNHSTPQKNDAIIAAKQALSEALDRRNEPGVIKDAPYGDFIIRYDIKSYDLVSIIIPTKNLGSMLDKCLTSVFNLTTYPNYEVILIDNGTTEPEAIEVMKKWQAKESERLRCFPLNVAFNYPIINHFAIQKSKGKYLLFLNNDIEVIASDWIEGMVEQAQRPSIGAIGALLLFPNDTVQHAGVVGGLFYSCCHGHRDFKLGEMGYFNQLNTVNNYSALTGACLMCRREVFEEVGGFDENLAVNYNDIDLCFKMIDKGYKNLYLPHVVLYHYESQTRGFELLSPLKKARLMSETRYFQSKWKQLIEHDPCYNPNLAIDRIDYQIRI